MNVELKKALDYIQGEIHSNKLRAILYDLYPDNKQERNLLLMVIECGIVAKIKKAKSISTQDLYIYKKIMIDDYGVQGNRAEWAILEWMKVYNKPFREDNNNLNKTDKSVIKVGSIVRFGRYKQSGADEIYPIEWRVLAVENGRALLISKYSIEYRKYNEEWIATSWENCTIRKWLNKEFINIAFAKEEQKSIYISNVKADKNPEYVTPQGNDTEDGIFLLSVKEVNIYLKSNDDRKSTDLSGFSGFWWLRSSGYNKYTAAYVNYDGEVHCYGYPVDNSYGTIRPSLWLNLYNDAPNDNLN